MNVINNNREDDVKTKDGEVIENVQHRYIGTPRCLINGAVLINFSIFF